MPKAVNLTLMSLVAVRLRRINQCVFVLLLPYVTFSMATERETLEDFLAPLAIDLPKIHSLARRLCETFKRLAKESESQFLPTPISDAVLRPSGDERGRYEIAFVM
jgi:hypothetical protein